MSSEAHRLRRGGGGGGVFGLYYTQGLKFTFCHFRGWLWKASGDIEKQWRTARRIEVRYSMFAAQFSICCSVSHLFFPMFSIQGSLLNVRRSQFAALFAICLVIRCAVCHSPHLSYSFFPIFAIQASLFNVRRAISHSHSPFANRRAIRCRFSMSPYAFHRW